MKRKKRNLSISDGQTELQTIRKMKRKPKDFAVSHAPAQPVVWGGQDRRQRLLLCSVDRPVIISQTRLVSCYYWEKKAEDLKTDMAYCYWCNSYSLPFSISYSIVLLLLEREEEDVGRRRKKRKRRRIPYSHADFPTPQLF